MFASAIMKGLEDINGLVWFYQRTGGALLPLSILPPHNSPEEIFRSMHLPHTPLAVAIRGTR